MVTPASEVPRWWRCIPCDCEWPVDVRLANEHVCEVCGRPGEPFIPGWQQ